MAELSPQPLSLPSQQVEQTPPPSLALNHLDVRQLMLKWQTNSQPWQWVPPSHAIAAMERLVHQVSRLRSPDSGWDASIPQTATTLAPYVSEEAADLLDAIEAALDATPAVPNGASASLGHSQPAYRLAEWIPQVLWAIARSQPTSMRLLEGTPAQVRRASDAVPHSGILRLVVVLELAVGSQAAAWDLVTGRPPGELLAPTTCLDVQPTFGPTIASTVAELLPPMMTAAQHALPELFDWWRGQAVELLWPGQGWQPGEGRFSLGLTFTPQAAATAAASTPTLRSANPLPQLHFTDSAWVEQYRQVAARSHLTQFLAGMAAVRSLAQANPPLTTEEAIAHLTTAALDWVTSFPATTLFSPTLPAAEAGRLPLDGLASQLSWQLSQMAYPVMQMLGGVGCQQLQPDLSWQVGILRLRPLLSLQTPETDWCFDLSSQQFLTEAIAPLPAQVVVRSEQLAWCQLPTLLSDLTAQLNGLIEQRSPELCLLQQGTAVDLLWDEVEPLPGALRLQLVFEFLA